MTNTDLQNVCVFVVVLVVLKMAFYFEKKKIRDNHIFKQCMKKPDEEAGVDRSVKEI